MKMTVLTTLALAAMVTSAHAVTINVASFATNQTYSGEITGGFHDSPNDPVNDSITSWTNNGGYNLVYLPTDATANSTYGSNNVTLKGNATAQAGHNNIVAPDGGNYVALDSDYGVGSISTTLSGLTVGGTVTITFAYAGAEQTGNPTNCNYNFNPTCGSYTDESLQVSLLQVPGSNPSADTQSVTGISYAGGSNTTPTWHNGSLSFIADNTTETLSFLAGGTASGLPSFVLLDNVHATETVPSSPAPEPGSLALLSTGLVGISGLVRSRFKK